jgi:hypothetical protein
VQSQKQTLLRIKILDRQLNIAQKLMDRKVADANELMLDILREQKRIVASSLLVLNLNPLVVHLPIDVAAWNAYGGDGGDRADGVSISASSERLRSAEEAQPSGDDDGNGWDGGCGGGDVGVTLGGAETSGTSARGVEGGRCARGVAETIEAAGYARASVPISIAGATFRRWAMSGTLKLLPPKIVFS